MVKLIDGGFSFSNVLLDCIDGDCVVFLVLYEIVFSNNDIMYVGFLIFYWFFDVVESWVLIRNNVIDGFNWVVKIGIFFFDFDLVYVVIVLDFFLGSGLVKVFKLLDGG